MPTMFRNHKTTTRIERRLLLRACPRCQGDLFHDDYEDEFFCLQCGRRVPLAMILTPSAETPVETISAPVAKAA